MWLAHSTICCASCARSEASMSRDGTPQQDERLNLLDAANAPTIRVGIHSALSYVPRDAEKADRDAKKQAMCTRAAYQVRTVEMTVAQFGAHVGNERGVMSAMIDGHRCNESAYASFLVADDDKIGDAFPENTASFHARTGFAVVM